MTSHDVSLLALRAAMGFFFFASGYRKVFVPATREHVTRYMRSLGVSPPLIPLVMGGELLGGLGLLVGALTPLAALGLIVILAGAIVLTCWPKVCETKPQGAFMWWTALCMQPEILMAAILLALTISGAGALSLDHIALNFWKGHIQ